MKKLILGVVALTTAVTLFAQGTIILNNRISGAPNGVNQTGHIWGPSSPIVYWPEGSLIGLGSNDSPSGTTPFGAASGMALIGSGGSGGHYGYATTFAQLIYALGSNQPWSSLVPAAGVTTFRSGTSLGDIASITATLGPGSLDAPFASVRIVAWDNSSGLFPTWTQAFWGWESGQIACGESAQFNVANIGGTANSPPFLTSAGAPIDGLSFNLFWLPEPSTFALAGLGAALLLIFRRRNR
jgi:hypothetical protein